MTNWTTNDIPDQTGRTAVITGANTGLGYETAAALAAKGANVVLAVRNTDKGKAAADLIARRTPGASVATGVGVGSSPGEPIPQAVSVMASRGINSKRRRLDTRRVIFMQALSTISSRELRVESREYGSVFVPSPRIGRGWRDSAG